MRLGGIVLAVIVAGCAGAGPGPVRPPGVPSPLPPGWRPQAARVAPPPAPAELPGPPCRERLACRKRGRCVDSAQGCRVGADGDCAASSGCEAMGLCAARDGVCVATESAHCENVCDRWGYCTVADGRCVRGSHADCARSELCREEGRCSLVDGECVAATDADCRASQRCIQEARCTAVAGACQPSAEDCRRHDDCAEIGRCDLAPENLHVPVFGEPRCIAASDASCRRSRRCAERGACAAIWDNCRPATEGHCRASRRCAEQGVCRFAEGSCVE